jgi:hypothetical protein
MVGIGLGAALTPLFKQFIAFLKRRTPEGIVKKILFSEIGQKTVKPRTGERDTSKPYALHALSDDRSDRST